MTITVRLPQQLREFAKGQPTLTFEATTTVRELLRELDATWPGVGRRVLDEQGSIRRHVHVYVGDERVAALTQPLQDGDEVTILPAVSGGS